MRCQGAERCEPGVRVGECGRSQGHRVDGQHGQHHAPGFFREASEGVECGGSECCGRTPAPGIDAKEEQQRAHREEQREQLAAPRDAVDSFSVDRMHREEQRGGEGEARAQPVGERKAVEQHDEQRVERDVRSVESGSLESTERGVDRVGEAGQGAVERTLRLRWREGKPKALERASNARDRGVGLHEIPVVVAEVGAIEGPVHDGRDEDEKEERCPAAEFHSGVTESGRGVTRTVTVSPEAGVESTVSWSTTRTMRPGTVSSA